MGRQARVGVLGGGVLGLASFGVIHRYDVCRVESRQERMGRSFGQRDPSHPPSLKSSTRAPPCLTPRSFVLLANRGDSRRLDDAVARYMTLSKSKAKTNARVLQSAFGRLTRDYPVEYVYRNVIARQLFLDRHSEHDTCLHELRIKDSIADVVILNGQGDVYEVKSAYGSPAKLST